MRLLTAIFDDPVRGLKPYPLMAECLRRSAAKLGYDTTIRSLARDPVVAWTPTYYKLDCAFKPFLLQEELDRTTEDLLWVDADCLLRERVDELLADADAAVTLRPLHARHQTATPEYDGYLNAGVVAVRNSPGGRALLRSWIAHLPGGRSDQDALARVLLAHDPLETYDAIVHLPEAKVRVVPTTRYNYFHLPGDVTAAKILHIKGLFDLATYRHYAEQILGADLPEELR